MAHAKWSLPMLHERWWDADSPYWKRIRILTARDIARDARHKTSKKAKRDARAAA